ncbi:MAG: circadian clock protein KaiC [Hyphomicrobiales bacterium]|nr:circadian clock protein KaiC [Hyphomicrobiales bacterium]
MADAQPIRTGVPGLDEILAGGYPSNRVHLIEGKPGCGKTTLGLQFLLRGVEQGEAGLYITLSETKRELRAVAQNHGWSLDDLHIFELVPPELSLDPKQQQTLLYASDLELGETVQMAIQEIERVKPKRIVFDSLSEIRLLSQSPLRYRRQVLALKHFFLLHDATVLMLDDLTAEQDDLNLHSISHGVIRLEQTAALYGAERRRLRVLKMRGMKFEGGYHDFVIQKGGLVLYPRLVASEHDEGFPETQAASSGVPELDRLVGGGLDRGTSTLLIGPSGSGKSTLSAKYLCAALHRGERGLLITFDETRRILLKRSSGIGIDLEPFLASGQLELRQIDPARLSPGELSGLIRERVEAGAQMVVIDSLTGYLNAIPDEQYMLLQMHELLTYLNQQGVVTILVLAQHGMVGQMAAPVDLTYISDTVIMLRFFEAEGRIRRALSVIKKRTGFHEDSIREYAISSNGLRVGAPLVGFQGVLTGVPRFEGKADALFVGHAVE